MRPIGSYSLRHSTHVLAVYDERLDATTTRLTIWPLSEDSGRLNCRKLAVFRGRFRA